ncbi:CLUMA_CG015461, isoform A [Clunio marinus]|uniref:Cilia- and flagella-associated protein 157 n=1 Tax=Clunio marinus TaxID=568069 RepID=A0A1J1IVA3_9DIPT|nr:CLUMA_CG015461, isoform A [Clunio marinus]
MEKKSKIKKDAEESSEKEKKLTNVEKRFYELEIAGIYRKIENIHARNKEVERQNKELERKLEIFKECRNDPLAHLNQEVKEKDKQVSDLEKKMSNLENSVKKETEEHQSMLIDYDEKFERTEKELYKEIDKLEKEFNSILDFRKQRKSLIEELETRNIEMRKKSEKLMNEVRQNELSFETKMHKEVRDKIYEMSTQFAKEFEINIPDSTQRLIRENVILKNAIHELTVRNDKVQIENEIINEEIEKTMQSDKVLIEEIKQLILTGQQQVATIENLYQQHKNLKKENTKEKANDEINKAQEKSIESQKKSHELQQKIKKLEEQIYVIKNDLQLENYDEKCIREDVERAFKIGKSLKLSVESALKCYRVKDDPDFREYQQKNIFFELLAIANELEECRERPSIETIPSISDLYAEKLEQFNLLHLTRDLKDSKDFVANVPILSTSSSNRVFSTPSIYSVVNSSKSFSVDEKCSNLMDPETATESLHYSSDSDSNLELENKPNFIQNLIQESDNFSEIISTSGSTNHSLNQKLSISNSQASDKFQENEEHKDGRSSESYKEM